MSQPKLDEYIRLLSKLRRDTKDGIKAPHKPVLLISVIQLIEEGFINTNLITISPELVLRFKENFNWLGTKGSFHPNFSLPFFHLHSDKLWHLQLFPGKHLVLNKSKSIRSFRQLKENVAYAYFDQELFELLKYAATRKLIYDFLLDNYFPDRLMVAPANNLEEYITEEILHSKPGQYEALVKEISEEEIYVRNAVFKKVVPKTYNYSCCITGLQIISPYNIQMVDACHIIPFAFSHDDTIGNGLSMSPNLHRAFDRGLVGINEDYTLIVSKNVEDRSPLGVIKNLEGIKINLPDNKEYYPLVENLLWHRKNIFRT